jgi:hypothetical protein
MLFETEINCIYTSLGIVSRDGRCIMDPRECMHIVNNKMLLNINFQNYFNQGHTLVRFGQRNDWLHERNNFLSE